MFRPNIYTHPNTKIFITDVSKSFDDHTSEMSGHDSESIYLFPSFDDEDEYKTIGIDEVEVDIEIKDFRPLKKAKNTYKDILSPRKYSMYIHSILARSQK